MVMRSNSGSESNSHNQMLDIWLASYNTLKGEKSLHTLRKPLNKKELYQEKKFHRRDDRKRYVVTRWLVRSVLSQYTSIPPSKWNFSANRFGRPEISKFHKEASGLTFNLSHTHGLIALGVTWHRAVGIDIEKTLENRATLEVAKHVFSQSEINELSQTPSENLHDKFFQYWTLKEAYTKAIGKGVLTSLDGFTFSFPSPNSISLVIDSCLGDTADRWSFWQCRPTQEHILSVCAERVGSQSSPPTFHKVLPPNNYKLLDLSVEKTTDSIT